jgi:hypothetical protein
VKPESDGVSPPSLRFAPKNTGNGASGPIWKKFYMQKDMPTFDQSERQPRIGPTPHQRL